MNVNLKPSQQLTTFVREHKDLFRDGEFKEIAKRALDKSNKIFFDVFILLKSSGVEPFNSLPDQIDIATFVQNLTDTWRHWQPGFFANSLDEGYTRATLSVSDLDKVKRICKALGFKVWETQAGYYGDYDLLVGLDLEAILKDEVMYDYDRTDFEEV